VKNPDEYVVFKYDELKSSTMRARLFSYNNMTEEAWIPRSVIDVISDNNLTNDRDEGFIKIFKWFMDVRKLPYKETE